MTIQPLTRGVEVAAEIKARNHWSVRILPPDKTQRLGEPRKCLDAVRRAGVRLRGLDYPPVEDDPRFGQNYQIDGGWECWEKFNDWGVWRFTESGQFLHLFTLREEGEDGWSSNLAQETSGKAFLSFENTIYQVTEIMGFIARLVTSIDYAPSVTIELALHGMLDRIAVADHGVRRRQPAAWVSGVREIEWHESLDPLTIPSRANDLIAEATTTIFSYFGLRTSDQLVNAIRQNLR